MLMGFAGQAITSLKNNRSLQRRPSFFQSKKAEFEKVMPMHLQKRELPKRSLEKIREAKARFWKRELLIYGCILVGLVLVYWVYMSWW